MKYLVLLAIVFQFPSSAIACSLLTSKRINPADAFLKSDIVVTGTLKTTKSSWLKTLAFWRDDELDNERVFEVSGATYLKGKPRDNIYVENMQSGMCGPFLGAGGSIILYLNSPVKSSQIYSIVLHDSMENLPAHMLDWRK